MSCDLTIREKFEKGIYRLNRIPRILSMSPLGVYINKNAPHLNEIENFEALKWPEDKILTQKFKVSSYGYWDFMIEMVNSEYFESREIFDKMFVEEDDRTVSDMCGIIIKQISIDEALKTMFIIDMSCNMDYYLSHQDDLENELNRKVDLENENLKKLEKEIFYKQMCNLFGGEEEYDKIQPSNTDETFYEKAFMLRDFCMISNDGNDILASALRGKYYLLLEFFY